MISDRVKEIRTQNGLTQTELGKKLSVTRASVNAWEMGISVPSVQLLVEMSRLFKVTVDYLLDLDGSLKIDIGYLTNEQREIVFGIIDQFRAYNDAVELLSANKISTSNDAMAKNVIDPNRLTYSIKVKQELDGKNNDT